MRQALLAFIHDYQQPLLYLYIAVLVANAIVFALTIWRWQAQRAKVFSQGASLHARHGLAPTVAMASGSFWLFMLLPFFIELLRRFETMWQQNPALIALYLLLAAIGLGLLLSGLRGWWRQRRSTEAFHLRENHLRPGGLVSGYYRTGSRGNGEPVRVHLLLQQTRLFGRHERYLLEKALWSDTLVIRPKIRGEGLEIPFLFHLPSHLPAIDKTAGRPEWVLVREGGGLNNDIRMVKAGQPGISAWAGSASNQATRPASALLPASARARHGQRNLWLDLAATAFVMIFPWVFWFLFDGARQPWLHLGQQLPPVLLAGLYFLIPFFTAVFALLQRVMKDAEEKARWRRWLWLASVGDLVLLVIALIWLTQNGVSTPDDGWFEVIFAFMAETVPRSMIGAFLWISLIMPLASIRYYWLRGRQTGE